MNCWDNKNWYKSENFSRNRSFKNELEIVLDICLSFTMITMYRPTQN